jgi:hypothetical protein
MVTVVTMKMGAGDDVKIIVTIVTHRHRRSKRPETEGTAFRCQPLLTILSEVADTGFGGVQGDLFKGCGCPVDTFEP